MIDIWKGMKAAFQDGRAKIIETVIIKMKDGEIKKYDADWIRKVFHKK
jgi:hypothetical protein